MAEWEVGGWRAEGDTVELVAPVEDVQQIYDVAREGYQCETFPVTSGTGYTPGSVSSPVENNHNQTC